MRKHICCLAGSAMVAHIFKKTNKWKSLAYTCHQDQYCLVGPDQAKKRLAKLLGWHYKLEHEHQPINIDWNDVLKILKICMLAPLLHRWNICHDNHHFKSKDSKSTSRVFLASSAPFAAAVLRLRLAARLGRKTVVEAAEIRGIKPEQRRKRQPSKARDMLQLVAQQEWRWKHQRADNQR